MKTLEGSLELLEHFFEANEPFSVGQVADMSNFPRSKVSRILAVFRDFGYVKQDPVTRRYSIGHKAFLLGALYGKDHPLAADALPIMREVVDWFDHTVTLTVRAGDDVFHLLAVEGPLFLDGRWRVGTLLPYHATASGKVLLSHLDEAELDAFIARNPLTSITSETTTDVTDLRAQISSAHDQGYCLSRGESVPGLAAVAVPVFGKSDSVIAALGLIIPDHLFDIPDRDAIVEGLHKAARRLSIQQGASVYPFGGRQVVSQPASTMTTQTVA